MTYVALLAVAVYDALISRAREKDYVWSQRLSTGSVIYYIHRYIIIIYLALVATLNIHTGAQVEVSVLSPSVHLLRAILTKFDDVGVSPGSHTIRTEIDAIFIVSCQRLGILADICILSLDASRGCA